MSSARWFAHAGAGLLLSMTGGCALLSKAEPLTPRYFSAEAPDVRAGARAFPASASQGAELELRLGRVTSAPYLRERLVFRSASHEVGFYEDRRWTEAPEAYCRRSLSRALYEEGGLRHVVSGSGPTLDVELVEFTEVRSSVPVARARATYVLYDRRSVRAEATVTVEVAIPIVKEKEQAAAAVGALSEALAGVVDRIARAVHTRLVTQPVSAASCLVCGARIAPEGAQP